MSTYQIRVEPQSYLLCSNAETTATLDSQFVFDQNGFPYFPGKTFKGLLKESMIEVLEMEGKTEAEIVESICYFFGVEGDHFNHGLLEISNLHLEGYDDQHPYFCSANRLTKYQIQQYFLTRVQQTAIDTDEIAKDTSLRTYGVLNHQRVKAFVAAITLDLSEKKITLLKHSLANLRRAGTRRNRGFGQILCRLTEINIRQSSSSDFKDQWINNHNALAVKITLREPTVLGTQNADANTVFSQDYVSGSQVLGMLAWAWKDKPSADFKLLFLDNKLVFSPCYPDGAQPLPTAIHKEKYAADTILHNILAGTSENTVTKGIGGFVSKEGGITVEKHFNFHASRPKRSAGRSMKEQKTGGIFYYEALAKGTVFEGEITGDATCLEKLYAELGGKNAFRLGKSKSSQYGNVEVEIKPIAKDTTTEIKDEYYMVAQSPLILYNEAGYPSPTKCDLERACDKKITIQKATARVVPIEQYNTIWLAKTGKVMAFEEGSTFKVTINESLPKEMRIGEWTHKGFGKVQFLTTEEMNIYKDTLLKEKEVPYPQGNPEPPAFVKVIIDHESTQKTEQNVQTQAYNDAEQLNKRLGKNRLSNSLISRMKAVLALSDADITAFFDESTQNGRKPFKDKPAGKALKDAYLYDDLKDTAITRRPYWTAFFEYLRKANNQ